MCVEFHRSAPPLATPPLGTTDVNCGYEPTREAAMAAFANRSYLAARACVARNRASFPSSFPSKSS